MVDDDGRVVAQVGVDLHCVTLVDGGDASVGVDLNGGEIVDLVDIWKYLSANSIIFL